jgi:hypothetical protein
MATNWWQVQHVVVKLAANVTAPFLPSHRHREQRLDSPSVTTRGLAAMKLILREKGALQGQISRARPALQKIAEVSARQ